MTATGRLAILAALCATFGAANAAPPQCVVPAKRDGGFDLTCKLAQAMLANKRELTLSYLPGGIGALAYTTIVTQRAADPDAIVAFSSGSLLNIAQGKFGPHSEADARWLAVVGTDYGAIAVRKDSPLRTLADVANALRSGPGSVSIGAGGTIGSQDWFKAALLARAAGVSHKSIRFVAFEGGGEALSALAGGHVDVFAGDAAEVSQYLAHASGVRLLAVLSERRLPGLFANVPTAREQGIDIVWPTARGFYVGPKVSDAAFREWSELFRQAMSSEGFAPQRARFGLYPMSLTGDDVNQFVAAHMARYRALAAEFQLPRK